MSSCECGICGHHSESECIEKRMQMLFKFS